MVEKESPDVFGLLLCGMLQGRLNNENTVDNSTLNIHSGFFLQGGFNGPKGESYAKDDVVFYSPIVEENFYELIVTDLGFDDKSLDLGGENGCSDYGKAFMNSGTTNLKLPEAIYDVIFIEMR